MNSDADSLALLKAIRNQAFNYQSQKELEQALFEATNRLQTIVQKNKVTLRCCLMDKKFKTVEFTFFTVAVLCKQSNSSLNKNWILLDNQSSVDVFCNSKLLKTSEDLRPQ